MLDQLSRRILLFALPLISCGTSPLPRYSGQTATSTENSPGASSETNGNKVVEKDQLTTASAPQAQTPPQPIASVPNATQATGMVTINLNLIPPTPAGTYRNRGHIRTLWITDANDAYVKTLQAFAGVRALHLKRWFNFTGNVPDATSGATQTTPAAGLPLTTTWDLKDKSGQVLKLGSYKLWMEFAETNTPVLDQGKKASDFAQAIDATNGYEALVVPFTIGAQASTKSDASNPVFKDVTIQHAP